jgi:putative membrane protein
MRVLAWLVRLVFFLVMMGFALSNTETSTLRFFGIPQFEWRAPLVLFLLVFFAAGTLLGVLAAVPTVLRQRRELGRLRRAAAKDAAAATRAAADATPQADIARLPGSGRESGIRGL